MRSLNNGLSVSGLYSVNILGHEKTASSRIFSKQALQRSRNLERSYHGLVYPCQVYSARFVILEGLPYRKSSFFDQAWSRAEPNIGLGCCSRPLHSENENHLLRYLRILPPKQGRKTSWNDGTGIRYQRRLLARPQHPALPSPNQKSKQSVIEVYDWICWSDGACSLWESPAIFPGSPPDSRHP